MPHNPTCWNSSTSPTSHGPNRQPRQVRLQPSRWGTTHAPQRACHLHSVDEGAKSLGSRSPSYRNIVGGCKNLKRNLASITKDLRSSNCVVTVRSAKTLSATSSQTESA